MHKALEARRLKREQYIREAQEYAGEVRDRLGEVCAFLIGSVARGDFNLGSDIDIIVISDALPPNPLERSRFLYELARPLIEPKGYTAQEFRQLLSRKHPTALAILDEGILLRDDGVWETVSGEV